MSFVGTDPSLPEDTPEMTVPLVMYRGGRRMIVGIATVKGTQINGVFDREAADELKDIIVQGLTTECSLGPFRPPRREKSW